MLIGELRNKIDASATRSGPATDDEWPIAVYKARGESLVLNVANGSQWSLSFWRRLAFSNRAKMRYSELVKRLNRSSRPKERVKAVDLFCGAAGLSLGLQRSGIGIAAGVDVDPACRYPFERNIGSQFIEKDICALSAADVQALFAGAGIRVLAGCAPCQPFSGYTTKRRSIDRRWHLLLEFLRIAEGVGPELLTVENVPRLIHLPLWKHFVSALEGLGYHVVWDILDASDYGVPQRRKRVVLLASRLGPIRLPDPRGGEIPTVRAAISTLPAIKAGIAGESDPLHTSRALTPKNLSRIRASTPSGTWREWPSQMRVRCHNSLTGRTYPSVYGRMSWDKPAPTMTTQFYGFGNGRFGHPEQDRAITLREGALLQSFPIDFEFVPAGQRISFRQIGRLIGNAVPPELGHAIGRAILGNIRIYGGATSR